MNEDKQQPWGRIGVLMGGYSSERAISLKSGKAVFQALQSLGLDVIDIDIESKQARLIQQQLQQAQIDLAFIALHGCLGEDGKIQEILEDIGLAYTGSGVAASRLALDKSRVQELLEKNGINVPGYVTLVKNKEFSWEAIINQLGTPKLVVKPVAEGSSIGVTIVDSPAALRRALEAAFAYGGQVLVEKFIPGREFTVGILGDQPLPVIEIRSSCDFFDFQAKYEKGKTEYIVPAEISQQQSQTVQLCARRVHQLVGSQDLSRVDFILGEDGAFYCLEINTIPGFTQTSLLPMAARFVGISFEQLCLKLVKMAYGKEEERQKNNSCCH